jgi:hypothetical protein
MRTIHEHGEARGANYFEQAIEVTRYGARSELFRQWVTGRKVLHIGCTDFPIFNAASNLHLQLAPFAKELVGLDTDRAGLAELQKHHPGRYTAEVSELDNETFDLVLMPETIEHIGDPERALADLLTRLKFREFVITAPSYHAWASQSRYEDGRFYETIHPEHFAWYSPSTLRRLLRDVVRTTDQVEFFFIDDERAVGARVVREQPTAPKKLTLVTGLFDLAARDGTNRRSVDEYLRLGEAILALDQDLICFADPPLVDRIRARREAHGYGDRTSVVPLAFEQLACFRHKAAAEAATQPSGLNPDKDTVNYALLGWAKFELIERALDKNPFDATHFAWVDLGVTHVADLGGPASTEPFIDPSDRIKLHMLRYFGPETVKTPEYWQQLQQNVAGGFFVGEASNMRFLVTAFWRAINLALSHGRRPLELDILPYLAVQAPERFTFSYGDYPDLFRNHVRLRRNGGHLLWIMRAAREHKAWQHSCAIGQLALEGYKAGTFDLAPEVVEKFLVEYYLAAYYRDYPRQDVAHEVASHYARLTYLSPQFRDVYREREQFIRDSFAYLNRRVLLP